MLQLATLGLTALGILALFQPAGQVPTVARNAWPGCSVAGRLIATFLWLRSAGQ